MPIEAESRLLHHSKPWLSICSIPLTPFQILAPDQDSFGGECPPLPLTPFQILAPNQRLPLTPFQILVVVICSFLLHHSKSWSNKSR